jgi:hypothetical protein
MATNNPVNYRQAVPDVLKVLEQVHVVMDQSGFENPPSPRPVARLANQWLRLLCEDAYPRSARLW